MKKSNFKDFLKKARGLDRIIRFSAQMRIKDESVAEHSFHAAFYAMILADLEEKIFKNKVDREKVLKTALLHDLEECLTGDIIHSFKHIDKNLNKEINRLGQKFFDNLMDNLPEKIAKEYKIIWKQAKDTTKIEGKIIEAADKLEGLIYSLNEQALGNREFEKIIRWYQQELKILKLASVNIILKQIL